MILSDLQRAVDQEGLLYPPDPTERGCFIGGTVATNASGARTFKYGPTRNYIRRLKVVLASGEVVDLRRGEVRADSEGRIRVGSSIEVQLPSYQLPQHARMRPAILSRLRWTRLICSSAAKAHSE